MLKDDRLLNEADVGSSADQPASDVPAKKRRRTKASATAASPTSNADQPSKTGNRGRGRPKGAKNKLTIEREKVQDLLSKEGPKTLSATMREPKDILIEAANFFMDRAQFLSDHAKRMAKEVAGATALDAIMEECERLVEIASKCAERAAPYYRPRVSEPLGDAAVVSYVARLPMPLATTEEWVATRSSDQWKQTGSH
jgi:hypothetical protein